MKLAVFTSTYPARVSSFFERDLRALIEAGVEIDVFAVAPLDPKLWQHSLGILGPEKLPPERIHHLTVGQSLLGARPSLASLSDAARILSSAVRHGVVPFAKTAYALPKAWAWAADYAGRFDHVLGYWGNYAATCAYAFHRLAGRPIPFSIWLHAGTDLYRTPVFMREKLLYSDNIITCCEFNEGYISRAFPDIAPQIGPKVHVCHHGLDLAQFPFRIEGRPSNRVLAVGRLAQHKGFDYLVRSIAELKSRGVDVKLDFVGDGEEQAALQGLAAQLGCADAVTFRGWQPFDHVRKAMGEATVLVHPSEGLGDGLPNVVREAMALGTPVIASDVAGIPDALSDGCGVLVPPRDVAALADAIAALLNDPGRRAAIATRARARTEERYDLWRNGTRLAGLLQQTRRGGPPLPLPRSATAPVPAHIEASSRAC
jgi:colanic acid/amylovoran biosynthesis glycosyltransferase